jgi:hypothetical protein
MMDQLNQMIKWLNENQGAASAMLASAMAILTAIYVWATIYLVGLTNKQLKNAIAIEAQRIRPHIVFEILSGGGVVTASIRNLGKTSARNLKVKITPELKCLLGGKNCVPAEETEEPMPLTARAIASLAPGRELTGFVAFWGRFCDYYPTLKFECDVSYEGPDGMRYEETVELDLAVYSNRKDVKVKGLPEIAANLEKIAESLSRLRSGLDVPLIRTIDEADYAKKQTELFDKAIRELERLKAQE